MTSNSVRPITSFFKGGEINTGLLLLSVSRALWKCGCTLLVNRGSFAQCYFMGQNAKLVYCYFSARGTMRALQREIAAGSLVAGSFRAK